MRALTILCDSHQHFLQIETILSLLHNHSHPPSNAINYKFKPWIGSLFCLQTSFHMGKHFVTYRYVCTTFNEFPMQFQERQVKFPSSMQCHFMHTLSCPFLQTYGRSRPDGYLNKKLGIFALHYFHNVNYTTTLFFLIDFILTYRSRRVIICKNINKKSAHTLSNKIQTFLTFLLILLKISYLQNQKIF